MPEIVSFMADGSLTAFGWVSVIVTALVAAYTAASSERHESALINGIFGAVVSTIAFFALAVLIAGAIQFSFLRVFIVVSVLAYIVMRRRK